MGALKTSLAQVATNVYKQFDQNVNSGVGGNDIAVPLAWGDTAKHSKQLVGLLGSGREEAISSVVLIAASSRDLQTPEQARLIHVIYIKDYLTDLPFKTVSCS